MTLVTTTRSGSGGSATDVVLAAEAISKAYPGTLALDQVDLKLRRSAVNLVVGENGAGKSTLMRILAGVEEPTSGRILMEGREITMSSPRDAAANAIAMIHQELSLCPNLSVRDNIFLGHELSRRRATLDFVKEREMSRDLLNRLGESIDPASLVGDLPLGQQQAVEITKALSMNASVLIMDEPTSALSLAEVEFLFRLIGQLKKRGISIAYISHNLSEALRIGDYVTVLRDGRVAGAAPTKDINADWVVRKMLGREALAPSAARVERSIGDPVLKVDSLSLARPGRPGAFVFRNLSFSVRAGEILGIYGLRGSGRSELLEVVAGKHVAPEGRIWLGDRRIDGCSLPERLRYGVVLIPEDRQRDGIFTNLSVGRNITLSGLWRIASRGYLSPSAEMSAAEDLRSRLGIRAASVTQPITELSGGNQQKAGVGRALMTMPKVLLMDDPTRGVDIGAKAEIFRIMASLAADGLGIVFVSSEPQELIEIADRILVISKGQITNEFARGEANEERLMRAAALAEPEQRELQHED